MTALDFIAALGKNTPSPDRMRSIGLDEDTVTSLQRFNIVIPHNAAYVDCNNIIDELQQNFDLSKIEIGLLTLFSKSRSHKRFVDFGDWDTNTVSWNLNTNEVQIISSETLRVLYRCAHSPEDFFHALAESDRFFNERLFDQTLWDDLSKIEQYAHKIANIAGGDAYETFYRIFLGVF